MDEALKLVAEARVLLDRLRWLLEGEPADPFAAALARLRAAHPRREDS